MTFAHAAILLSFMQVVEEYLVAFKDFNYSCYLGSKWPITSKSKLRDIDEMKIAKDLKFHDLIFSFLFLSRTNIASKTFWLIMEAIDTLLLFLIQVLSELSQFTCNHSKLNLILYY